MDGGGGERKHTVVYLSKNKCFEKFQLNSFNEGFITYLLHGAALVPESVE